MIWYPISYTGANRTEAYELVEPNMQGFIAEIYRHSKDSAWAVAMYSHLNQDYMYVCQIDGAALDVMEIVQEILDD